MFECKVTAEDERGQRFVSISRNGTTWNSIMVKGESEAIAIVKAICEAYGLEVVDVGKGK